MEAHRALRLVKDFEDAYNRAYAESSLRPLRPGFHPNATVVLNGRPFPNLDAYFAWQEDDFEQVSGFEVVKSLRGIDGDRLTVTYVCKVSLQHGGSQTAFGLESWVINDADQLTKWIHNVAATSGPVSD